MIWMMLEEIPTITPFLKCWVTGLLVIISRFEIDYDRKKVIVKLIESIFHSWKLPRWVGNF